MKQFNLVLLLLLCGVQLSYGQTITQTVSQPSSCYNSGSITLSGLMASTTYSLHYTKDGAVQPVININSDASGAYRFNYLSSGTYSNIYVSSVSGSSNILGPDVLTAPTPPVISIASSQQPTTCAANNGWVKITGLQANTSYTYTYMKNGVLYRSPLIVADATGKYTISGMGNGVYSAISFTQSNSGCTSSLSGSITLADLPLVSSVTSVGTCSNIGSISLGGMVANTSYVVSYRKAGLRQTPISLTSDNSGNLIMNNLVPGIYDSITVKASSCNTSSAPVSATVASLSALPNISQTITQPTVCTYNNGSITLSGMSASTTYKLNYTYNGTVQAPMNITSTSAGKYSFSYPPQGVYSNMYISSTGCNSNILGPDTLTNPAAPAAYIALTQQPSDCIKNNGYIQIGGLKPGATYTFSYTKDGGATINSSVIGADVNGKYNITGLTKGIYDNIKFKPSATGCVTTSLGPDTLSSVSKVTIYSTAASCLALGNSLSLTASSASTGLAYSWSGPHGFTANTATVNIASVSNSDTGNYTVTATVSGCTSYPTTTNVSIKTPTAPVATNSGVTCNGQALNLFASTVSGATYNWSGPNGYTSTTQNPTIPSLTSAYAGVYSVTASKGGCISTVGTTSVTVNPVLSVTMSAVNPVCAGTGTTIVLRNGPARGTVIYKIHGGSNQSVSLDDTGAAYLNTGTLYTTVTYKLVSISNGTCTYEKNDSFVVLVTPDMWTGAIDSNWNNPGNWCGGVPTTETPVSIPSGTPHAPVVPSGFSTNNTNLVISNGAFVKLSSNSTFNVSGNLTTNGNITGDGAVLLNGNSSQTIGGTGTISNLIVDNSAGVAIDTTGGKLLNVTGVLTLNSGIINTNNGLVLVSDSTGTGSIGTITGGGVSGQVAIQRYVPGGRRCYRFFSHPYTTTIALNPELTSKVDITGAGGAANGFTPTQTNNASAFWYNTIAGNPNQGGNGNDPGWTAFTSANATSGANGWKPYEGIRVLVRGAVGQGLNGGTYTPSATTLQTNGIVNTGRVIVPLQKGALSSSNLVGNPYPSPVNITPILYAAKQAGYIGGNSFYVWDAEAGTVASPGAYITHAISNLSADDYYLPTNGVFVVNAAVNNGSLTFNETDKVASGAQLFRTTSGPANRVEFRIYSNHDSVYWDRMYTSFEPLASNGVDNYDGGKASNPGVNFYSIASDGTHLSIDARPFVNNMMIPIGFKTTMPAQTYKIKVQASALTSDHVVYLVDNYLNTVQQMDLGSEYTFSVTSDSLSQGDNRFQLNAMLIDTTTTSVAATTIKKANALTVELSPNPATVQTSIKIEAGQKGATSVSIMNVSGLEVYSINLGEISTHTVDVPLQNLAAGIYMVKVTCGTEVMTQRLIKQ